MSYSNGKAILPMYNSDVSNSIQKTDQDKSHLSNTESKTNNLKIYCCDLNQYNSQNQFLICCAGIFVLYLLYGYFQELIFSLDGFKPYGWYLTLVQFGYYTIFGYFEKNIISGEQNRIRKIPMKTYFLIAFLTLGTMGLSNSSLAYLNYPTQVIFKCCKLVPVLIGSILIQKKKHGPLDFLAAIAMCIGLTAFTLVDSTISPNFNMFGISMISCALLFDAAIGNVQEKAMREHGATNVEVVFYSYGIGFVYLLVVLILSGNILSSIRFCATYPIQTYGYAFLFSLTGYLGIQFVLTLVRGFGATIAATVTTARKAITIILSFFFFSKPFSFHYIWAGLIVVLGIYLNVFSKRNKMTTRELLQKLIQLIGLSNTRRFTIINKKESKGFLNV